MLLLIPPQASQAAPQRARAGVMRGDFTTRASMLAAADDVAVADAFKLTFAAAYHGCGCNCLVVVVGIE